MPPKKIHDSQNPAYAAVLKDLEKIRSNALEGRQGTGRLDGKVGVVTGVGSLRGIGRSTSLLLAREGALHLYLLDFDDTNLPGLRDEITKRNKDVSITVQKADASDSTAIESICKRAIKECGRLDFFFANAGIAPFNFLHDVEADQFMHVMKVNSLSCFLAIKFASQAMAVTSSSKPRPGGSIVLTASVAGLRAGAGSIDYSASKAAVCALAKVGASQLSGTGVRVNAICPGFIVTNMTGPVFDLAQERGTASKVGQLNPLQRYGIPEEVAQLATWLCADESSYVNGQEIAVDGGLSSSHPFIPGKMA